MVWAFLDKVLCRLVLPNSVERQFSQIMSTILPNQVWWLQKKWEKIVEALDLVLKGQPKRWGLIKALFNRYILTATLEVNFKNHQL
jgi:hypothetical protein